MRLTILSYETLAIIAEGVPERQTREIIARAAEKQVALIGPATVGGIKPGCFRIGNTGGMLDNIVLSKLYRPGSVGYVSSPEACRTNSTILSARIPTVSVKVSRSAATPIPVLDLSTIC